jgi:hypothetical protein
MVAGGLGRMLAGVTDKSATRGRSWSPLSGRGVELRMRGLHKQKKEDAGMKDAKGHNGQALWKGCS